MSAIPSRVHKLRVSGSNRRSAIKHAVWVKARCHLPLGEPSLCNLACCVLLLRFFGEPRIIGRYSWKANGILYWSKMSNSNRSSASQTQRAAITLHSGYGAAGGIQTHDPCFRRPGLSGKCMSLHHCGISTLSVQESTVFPICHSNSCSSVNELVGIVGFKPTWFPERVWIVCVCQFRHIPILPVFPGCQPRAGHFRRKKIS